MTPMCEHGTTTVVETPDWLWSTRSIPENGIGIDSCIAEEVVAAWDQGVRTLGSCCGHGKEAPSVVLTSDPDQPEIARHALPGWSLLQWQLVSAEAGDTPTCRHAIYHSDCDSCNESDPESRPGHPWSAEAGDGLTERQRAWRDRPFAGGLSAEAGDTDG